jgi:hypothetical protein
MQSQSLVIERNFKYLGKYNNILVFFWGGGGGVYYFYLGAFLLLWPLAIFLFFFLGSLVLSLETAWNQESCGIAH